VAESPAEPHKGKNIPTIGSGFNNNLMKHHTNFTSAIKIAKANSFIGSFWLVLRCGSTGSGGLLSAAYKALPTCTARAPTTGIPLRAPSMEFI
jgi:hypothetical protein